MINFNKVLYFILKNRVDRVFGLIILLLLIVPYQNCSDNNSLAKLGVNKSSSSILTPPNNTLPATPPVSGPTTIPAECNGNKIYYSPNGSGDKSGSSEANSKAALNADAFVANPGDVLILLDGDYPQITKPSSITGSLSTTQIPSGTSLNNMTCIIAKNSGKVKFNDVLKIGAQTSNIIKYVYVKGITFNKGGSIYNGQFITVKDCGFNGGFNVGTNDSYRDPLNNNNRIKIVSSYNLIEDVWIWAQGERGIVFNYQAHFNVWRRVIVRGDGCGKAECSGSGNPNIGFTVYDSHDVSLQNVIVVDRILAATDQPYSDFASAQHTNDPQFYVGRAEWLGTISVNAPDWAYQLEPDLVLDPTYKVINAAAYNNTVGGLNITRNSLNTHVENYTGVVSGNSATGLRIYGGASSIGTVRNILVTGTGAFGVTSVIPSEFVNLFGNFNSRFYSAPCTTNCTNVNPALKYLTRIENDSPLKAKGYNGADIGANIVYRYGADGTRFGDANYNSLTNIPLWPWPNEDRIKAEMCLNTTRGFCSTGKRLDGTRNITLTSYIWELLGNPIPNDIYN